MTASRSRVKTSASSRSIAPAMVAVAAKQRVGGRDPGPQFSRRAGHRRRETGGAFTLGVRFELDRAGQRMADEAGKRAKIGNRQTGAPLDRSGFRHLPGAGESNAGALGGKPGQIDGAAVASSGGGERPIDVAAELGRHRDPLRRNQPEDAALRRQADAGFGIVESAGRACPNIGLDVLCSGGGERVPSLDKFSSSEGRLSVPVTEAVRAAEPPSGWPSRPAKRGKLRDIGAQIRRHSLFPGRQKRSGPSKCPRRYRRTADRR